MTVSTLFNKAIGTGNGVATSFPFSFGTLPTTDLAVSVFDTLGVESVKVEGLDYTVVGGGQEDGGAIVFNTAPANLSTVLIQRIIPLTQPTDIKNQGSYYPKTIERAFGDRMIMILQQQQERINASLSFPPQVIGADANLPTPVPLAALVFSADGKSIEAGSTTLTGDMLLRGNLAASTPGNGAALVTFKAVGGSTVARGLDDRLSEDRTVTNFMTAAQRADAANNLATLDCTAALQAAINSIPAGMRANIRLPAGTFKITAPIAITNRGIRLYGDSKITSIIDCRGCDGFVITGEYNFEMVDIGMTTDANGSYTAIKYNVGQAIYTLDTLKVDDCQFSGRTFGLNYWAVAVSVGDVSNTWFERVSVYGPINATPSFGGYGVSFSSSTDKASTGHHFTRCTFNGLERGVSILANHFPSYEGIRVLFTGFVGVRYGLYADASASSYTPPLISFAQSHVDLNSTSVNPCAVYIRKYSQVDITNNDIYEYSNNCVGIWLIACNTSTLSDNVFVTGGATNVTAVLLSGGTLGSDVHDNKGTGPFSQGLYALADAGVGNTEHGNRWVGATNQTLDGTGKIFRNGKTQVRVIKSAAQDLTTAVAANVSWDSASPNWGASWVIGSPARVTLPSGARSVRISGVLRFGAAANGLRRVVVKKNGAYPPGGGIAAVASSGGSDPTDVTFSSAVLDVAPGDYFEVEAYQTSGGAIAVDAPSWVQVDVLEYWE